MKRMGVRGNGTGLIRVPALAAALLLLAGPAFAAAPAVMPGFPLRAGNNVMLMWTLVPGAAEYVVYRSEKPGGPYQKISAAPMNNYMDMNVPMDKTYYYVVKGVIGGKEGDPSPEVMIRGVEPMKPPVFGGQLVTEDGKLSIRWDTVPNAAFYNLYRAESEKGDFRLVTSLQDNKYTDSNVSLGKTYFYKVSSVSAANVESKQSETLQVKVEKAARVQEGTAPIVEMPAEYVDAFEVDQGQILMTPKDLDTDDSGAIYAVDSRGFVQKISPDFKYLATIGAPPAGSSPREWGMANANFVPKDRAEVYVCYADKGGRVFGADGGLLRTFALKKPDPKASPVQSWEPDCTDVALAPDGTLWVLDGNYYQLVNLDAKGEEVRRIGLPREHPDRKKEGGEKNLVAPGFLYVSPKNGDLFVLEALMQRVTQYDKDGKFLRWIGGRGEGPGRFILPAGLAVDETGVLYVGDRNQETVQAFDGGGKYAGTFVNPKIKDPQKRLRIAKGVSGLGASKGNLYISSLFGDKAMVYRIQP